MIYKRIFSFIIWWLIVARPIIMLLCSWLIKILIKFLQSTRKVTNTRVGGSCFMYSTTINKLKFTLAFMLMETRWIKCNLTISMVFKLQLKVTLYMIQSRTTITYFKDMSRSSLRMMAALISLQPNSYTMLYKPV